VQVLVESIRGVGGFMFGGGKGIYSSKYGMAKSVTLYRCGERVSILVP
jgi:hypothetical protein